MSDPKSGLGGLFVNKKVAAAVPTVSGATKPKNVKQRWAIIGIAAVGFIVVSSSFFSKKPDALQQATKPEGSVLITPGGVGQKDWISQSAARFAEVKDNEEKMKAQVANMTTQLQLMRDRETKRENEAKPPLKVDVVASGQIPGNIVPPPSQDSSKNQSAGKTLPPPPPPTLPAGMLPIGKPGGQTTFGMPDVLPVPGPAAEPQIFKPEARAVPSSSPELEGVKATARYKTNQYSGFLPAGSFAPVVLLNGLDAGTSTATQANPMPVLMNITDQATLPGAAKYIVKSCFVLGTGFGDLSAERVYVRYSRMSCVDKRDRLVLTADVSGYLVDSDGKLGLRGKIIDRQGAKLGKALLAGFAQGLAGALGSAQSAVTSTVLGATSTISGGDALKASGLTGAQSAAQQLAQFYLKEAQAIFPVISIDTGRTGTIVFTDNASLTWSSGDAQYVKEVKPD